MIRFGKNAQKILLYTMPVIILLALALTIYVARLDGAALLKERNSIVLVLETISRICVCLALGTVLADYAERKTKENA
jgi:hypothetical protein